MGVITNTPFQSFHLGLVKYGVQQALLLRVIPEDIALQKQRG